MSKISIVNRALTFLGANRIASLEDDTLEARSASNMYDESLKSILSECDWKFATKRVLLNKLDKEPQWVENGKRNYFQLPSDFVEIFGVRDENSNWTIEGNTIVADVPDFAIKYVYFCTNTNLYTSSFIEAFACKLASDMCYEITNSNEKAMSLIELYKGEYLPLARNKNAREASKQLVDDGAWASSIFGGIEG